MLQTYISAGDICLEQIDAMKYLGVHLDRFLTFDAHTEKIEKKVSQRTRLLWKMRSFISQNLAKYLYQTLINPIFTYCDFVYDGMSKKNKDKLQISQNAALRAVKRCPMDYPLSRLHNELEIDTLEVCRQKSTLKMVYRGLNDLGPPSLNSIFKTYIPTRTLRSENQLLILPPKTNLIFTECDISHRGCIYWNQVPIETKHSTSIDTFKCKLKKYGTEAIT